MEGKEPPPFHCYRIYVGTSSVEKMQQFLPKVKMDVFFTSQFHFQELIRYTCICAKGLMYMLFIVNIDNSKKFGDNLSVHQ